METTENTRPAHQFANDPHQDGPDTCTCGAAFYDGFNLQAVKVAHLRAHGAEVPAPTTLPAALSPKVLAATLQIGLDGLYDDETRELAGLSMEDVDALEAFVRTLS